MAAPAAKMVAVSSDSSEDEALERCKEAVWDAAAAKTGDGQSNGTQSRRVIVSAHEHDGNELQVSHEFRSHVAKKLGHILDSCISEVTAETTSLAESTKCDDNDEGFRLFTSSIPGQKADDSPPPVRQRPIPSSSDSDSEMETRLREAAVSVSDLQSSFLLFSAPLSSLPEKVKKKKKKKKKKKPAEEEGEDNPVPKKQKKRKVNQEESEQVMRKLDSAGSSPHAQSNGAHGDPEEGRGQLKVKRKKKKKKKKKMGIQN